MYSTTPYSFQITHKLLKQPLKQKYAVLSFLCTYLIEGVFHSNSVKSGVVTCWETAEPSDFILLMGASLSAA